MTTYAELKSNISRILQDPDGKTFTPELVADIAQAALAEIGRVAPQQFQEDIDLIADSNQYVLRSTEFGAAHVPEIEVNRVEIWDGSQTPAMPLQQVPKYDSGYLNFSETGYKVWDGVLELPRWVPVYVNGYEGDYLIKVWGYSPYPPVTADADVIPLSNEREQALYSYSRVEGLEMLNGSRELFTQWQTRSGNTDMSPAGLMNALNIAMESWRRKSRAIAVLREG